VATKTQRPYDAKYPPHYATCLYCCVERGELRAEVERLVEKYDSLNAYAHKIEEESRQSAFEVERLRALLQRIAEWDHMDSAADGPYWRSEIDKALAPR
jgi:hypothetical protein